MIILSNAMSATSDEGSVKVANSLIKRIKAKVPAATVLTYERHSVFSDKHMNLNKLFLNLRLAYIIRKQEEEVLYVPFPARGLPISIRTFVLSLMSPKRIHVLLIMTGAYGNLAKWLMCRSGAHIYALSQESVDYYSQIVGDERVTYLQTGVDTEKFTPVSAERVAELKKAYGLDPNKKLVLHVGHMKEGRNIAQLSKIDEKYQVLLVVSTFTASEDDWIIREQIENAPNIRIIDNYVSNIEEIYQMADVYFFPVTNHNNCIDIPLSVLEAASCGKPVVTTAFGEVKNFMGKEGFYFISDFEADTLNSLLDRAVENENTETRKPALKYDWHFAVSCLTNLN